MSLYRALTTPCTHAGFRLTLSEVILTAELAGTLTHGARHLAADAPEQTNRLQYLRTDIETLLREASNTKYVAFIEEAEKKQQGKPKKRKKGEDHRPPGSPYVVNTEIARSIRVSHARHLPT